LAQGQPLSVSTCECLPEAGYPVIQHKKSLLGLELPG